MQRQGVPLLISESPLVGTGMEGKVARDSRAVIVAEGDGIAASVAADFIIVTKDGHMPDPKNACAMTRRTVSTCTSCASLCAPNAGTCVNQKPIIKKGQKIKAGDVLADGPNTELGELALGRNVLVASCPGTVTTSRTPS